MLALFSRRPAIQRRDRETPTPFDFDRPPRLRARAVVAALGVVFACAALACGSSSSSSSSVSCGAGTTLIGSECVVGSVGDGGSVSSEGGGSGVACGPGTQQVGSVCLPADADGGGDAATNLGTPGSGFAGTACACTGTGKWYASPASEALVQSRSLSAGACVISQFGIPPDPAPALTFASDGRVTANAALCPTGAPFYYNCVGTWHCDGTAFVAEFVSSFHEAGVQINSDVITP